MTFEEEMQIVKTEFETNTWITETACHKAWESACERADKAAATARENAKSAAMWEDKCGELLELLLAFERVAHDMANLIR